MANQTIINPLTPLAYVSPTVAVQFEATRYVYVGVFGAFIWDWLMSLGDEYRMIRKSKGRSLPVIVYFMDRLATLGFLITITLFQAASIPDCNGLLHAISVFFILTMSLSSFLFYLRVWAVFRNNRIAQVFFGFLYISVFGTSLITPFAPTGAHIGPTQYCINSAVRSFTSAPVIASAVNDTLIFIAISYKLVRDQKNQMTLREIGTSFFKGDGLSVVSKSLYKSGQIYYLSTIGMNIASMSVILSPSTPAFYRAMISAPNIGLESMLACRVFRQIRLGKLLNMDGTSLWGDQQSRLTPLSLKPIRTRTGMHTEISRDTLMDNPGQTGSSAKVNDESEGVINIKVTRDVELAMDRDRMKT